MKTVLKRITFLVIFFTILVVLISYARGYRFNFLNKSIESTGILVASSYPNGAKIYIDGKLTGATNTNIPLQPGQYLVEIKKEGYTTWKKKLSIKGEVVIKADALLFPLNPSLSPITSLGVSIAKFLPNFGKTILISLNEDVEKDGIYLLENKDQSLSIFNPLKLIALKSLFPQDFDLIKAKIEESFDGKQIMVSQEDKNNTSYLLSIDEQAKNLFNTSGSENTIKDAWKKSEIKNEQKILETYKDPLPQIASDSIKIISFSPDESKILYIAKINTKLEPMITPPIIGANQTKEERDIKINNVYVYDKKEDKNFLININRKNLKNAEIEKYILWYPDSKHLVINEEKKISIVDYDNDNKQTVYSGPFESDFFAISSEGKLLILANLNPQNNKLPDVYAVGIK